LWHCCGAGEGVCLADVGERVAVDEEVRDGFGAAVVAGGTASGCCVQWQVVNSGPREDEAAAEGLQRQVGLQSEDGSGRVERGEVRVVEDGGVPSVGGCLEEFPLDERRPGGARDG
jgi:hypothetical protein